jgi:hypothetical protein
MVNNLKSCVQSLCIKYSWHTLGDKVTSLTQKTTPATKHAIDKLESDLIRKLTFSSPTATTPARKKRIPKSKGVILEDPLNLLDHVVFKPNTKSKKLLAERESLTQQIYKQYNEMAFDCLLPSDLPIS